MKTDLGRLITIIALVITFAIVPLTSTATISPAYGTVVTVNSSTTGESSVITQAFGVARGPADIKWWDETATAAPSTTSEWYVDLDGSNTVNVNDLRIFTSVSGKSSGTQVGTGDADIGRTLRTAGTYNLCYIDMHTSDLRPANSFSPASATTPSATHEPLYIHLGACSATAGTGVSNGDIRVTSTPSEVGSFAAGTRVATGDADRANNGTRQLTTDHATAAFRYYDADSSFSYSKGDWVYLDMDPNTEVNPGDVRFTPGGTLAFGTVAQIGDADVIHALTSIAAAHLAFFDADGSAGGTPNCSSSTLQDTVILRTTAGGTTVANDIRITARTQTPTKAAGTKIISGESDHGQTTTDVTLRYHDVNSDGRFDFGDTVYIDIGTANTIDAGDIRLSANNAFGGMGSCVLSTDNDRNLALVNLPATAGWYYVDTDNSATYSRLDLVYLRNQDAVAFVSLGQFRMQGIWTTAGALGSVVGDDDVDSTMFLRSNTFITHSPALSPTFKYFDLNSDGSYNGDEPVYLSMKNQATIQSGDIRISGFDGKAAGSSVASADSDHNKDLVTTGSWNPRIMYVETGTNSGGFDDTDNVYLKLKTSSQLELGDIRLRGSAGSAGSKVSLNDADMSNSLTALPNGGYNAARLHYFKSETSTASDYRSLYTSSDLVYYDTDNNDNITIGDIHMTGSGGVTTEKLSTTQPTSNPTTQPSTNPNAAFTVVNTNQDTRTITVDAGASTAASGRTLSTYTWNWGDGKTDSGAQTQRSHQYSSDGSYTVVLTVTDNQGSTNSASRSVTIGEPVVTTTTTTPATTETTATTTQTTETTATTEPSPSETEPVATPGPGMLGILAALGVTLVLLRRRR